MCCPPDLRLSTLFWVRFDTLGFRIALEGKSPPAGALIWVSSKPIPLLLPSNMQKQLVLTSHFPFPLSQATGIPPDRCRMWGCRSLPWGAPGLVVGCAGLGVGLTPPRLPQREVTKPRGRPCPCVPPAAMIVVSIPAAEPQGGTRSPDKAHTVRGDTGGLWSAGGVTACPQGPSGGPTCHGGWESLPVPDCLGGVGDV